MEKSLDELLVYHLQLIETYEERHPLQDLHKSADGDFVLSMFGLTDDAFVKLRWRAGFANSCSTNLGRFFDKASKLLLSETFGIPLDTLQKKMNVGSSVEQADAVVLVNEAVINKDRLLAVIQQINHNAVGLGFEFRSRYGKNDDTLLQKDENVAEAMQKNGLVPVLAVFSTNNAAGAIRRLKRKWHSLQGEELLVFLHNLTGFDLKQYLQSRTDLLSKLKTRLAA